MQSHYVVACWRLLEILLKNTLKFLFRLCNLHKKIVFIVLWNEVAHRFLSIPLRLKPYRFCNFDWFIDCLRKISDNNFHIKYRAQSPLSNMSMLSTILLERAAIQHQIPIWCRNVGWDIFATERFAAGILILKEKKN